MERAEERDDVRPLGGVAGELDRGLDDLRAGVAEVGPRLAASIGAISARRRQAVGVDRQVEVGRGEVDELGGLLLDRGHDLRVRVAGRGDRDAGGEVEEEVAVDVLDGQALAADRHDRVGAGQARGGPFLIERHVRAGLRAGQLGDDVRDGTIAGETRRGR